MALWAKASLCVKSSLLEQNLLRTQSRPKTSAPSVISVAKNLFNQCNPRLINDLRLRKSSYEKIKLFMQNEPNFRKSQVNVSDLLIRDYDQMDTWSIRKNEPKTNPNEPKTNPILANKTPIRTQTNPKRTQSPAGSSAARKKSISCARQLVREYKDSPIKSLPKITENILNVEKKSHTRRKNQNSID